MPMLRRTRMRFFTPIRGGWAPTPEQGGESQEGHFLWISCTLPRYRTAQPTRFRASDGLRPDRERENLRYSAGNADGQRERRRNFRPLEALRPKRFAQELVMGYVVRGPNRNGGDRELVMT